MATLNAKNLTLSEIHQLLKLDERFSLSFEMLCLEPLTEEEQQEITQIRKDFRYYPSFITLGRGKALRSSVREPSWKLVNPLNQSRKAAL